MHVLTSECIELLSYPRVEAEVLHQFHILVGILQTQILCQGRWGRVEGRCGEREKVGRCGREEVSLTLKCSAGCVDMEGVVGGGKCQLY